MSAPETSLEGKIYHPSGWEIFRHHTIPKILDFLKFKKPEHLGLYLATGGAALGTILASDQVVEAQQAPAEQNQDQVSELTKLLIEINEFENRIGDREISLEEATEHD